VTNAVIGDMTQDIALGMFSRPAMVGKLIVRRIQQDRPDAGLRRAYAPDPWRWPPSDRRSARPAAYVNEGGSAARALRADVAAEAAARQTYEALIRRREDAGRTNYSPACSRARSPMPIGSSCQ
jgi:Mn-containing catalase